ncbi:hypothetical protein SAMD00019534_026150 [Acytostelium subglobosum LB1]|uniref:hypothetical protein n=1 Tax=Acytostelium subglobosum LB1 TaxID=1410327 RepID=UPI000644847D|nr:hypothetical protein SAMD00019534_026150 [Acytostelium subglobosum LB1]GAM19440.1 hypothetical protein SAMD00019534_026150 [Acytostelium subglobosum LB1]|eukprot:XP_012757367.1 hypothetical protein SAMD00019534_026150 [Acytostelium subglobosum LB1]
MTDNPTYNKCLPKILSDQDCEMRVKQVLKCLELMLTEATSSSDTMTSPAMLMANGTPTGLSGSGGINPPGNNSFGSFKLQSPMQSPTFVDRQVPVAPNKKARRGSDSHHGGSPSEMELHGNISSSSNNLHLTPNITSLSLQQQQQQQSQTPLSPKRGAANNHSSSSTTSSPKSKVRVNVARSQDIVPGPDNAAMAMATTISLGATSPASLPTNPLSSPLMQMKHHHSQDHLPAVSNIGMENGAPTPQYSMANHHHQTHQHPQQHQQQLQMMDDGRRQQQHPTYLVPMGGHEQRRHSYNQYGSTTSSMDGLYLPDPTMLEQRRLSYNGYDPNHPAHQNLQHIQMVYQQQQLHQQPPHQQFQTSHPSIQHQHQHQRQQQPVMFRQDPLPPVVEHSSPPTVSPSDDNTKHCKDSQQQQHVHASSSTSSTSTTYSVVDKELPLPSTSKPSDKEHGATSRDTTTTTTSSSQSYTTTPLLSAVNYEIAALSNNQNNSAGAGNNDNNNNNNNGGAGNTEEYGWILSFLDIDNNNNNNNNNNHNSNNNSGSGNSSSSNNDNNTNNNQPI